jgi:hypothetical protein
MAMSKLLILGYLKRGPGRKHILSEGHQNILLQKSSKGKGMIKELIGGV